MTYKKKLIEVALPLEAINVASAREKSIRHGHPSTLHLWWARRPLAAARAVIFAQMVDDPSSHPDIFKTEKAQEKERQRLFRIIEELVKWENTSNETVLQQARDEILRSWQLTCRENSNHPDALNLFDPKVLPSFHDPFAGGGALPLEAQRLGLESYASDLNPLPVLINKAMIEIPVAYAGQHPINSESRNSQSFTGSWRGALGLAEDVNYYGKLIRAEAEKRIGNLYPKVAITKEIAYGRDDLTKYVGKELNVIAWFWVRTVKSPNPAFSDIDVPLASTFMLSTKTGKEVYIEPNVFGREYTFSVIKGKPVDYEKAKNGTKLARANFFCLMSGAPISGEYIKSEGIAGRIGSKLLALVLDGDREKVYLEPISASVPSLDKFENIWEPDVEFYQQALGFRVGNYGVTKWSEFFSKRQLIALTTFSSLVTEVRALIFSDAIKAGLLNDGLNLERNGKGADAYADAVTVYLAFVVDRLAQYWSMFGRWQGANQQLSPMFGMQAIPMVWDYPEPNPFSFKGGSFDNLFEWTVQSIVNLGFGVAGHSQQADAATQQISINKVISTDPPYYDNIGYADLSDFFYVWLRKTVKSFFPILFGTVTVPKSEELVATPGRHGGKENAEKFFLDGMTLAMGQLTKNAHEAFPITIYYAFKQSEGDSDTGISSTGWETFLNSIVNSGLSITGTWPMRTEMGQRMRGVAANSLATSIVLVCRKRSENAHSITRREFISQLKLELPTALVHLQAGNIAPVDLAQASIGPGMAVYSQYKNVLDADGQRLSVRSALALINQTLDEVLAEQEGDFDADSRWAVTWFDQVGFSEGDFDLANTLAQAKNTGVDGLVHAGIIVAGKGKVRLLRPEEFATNWDPDSDKRLTIWEVVHQLIRVLESGGESHAAKLVAKLGYEVEAARELCYRLYSLCERKKRATDALAYNGLVQSWNEITRLAGEETPARKLGTNDMFEQE
jgi:putative DNA methylase